MRQTLVLDSTQISDYLTCPQMWHYLNVEQIVSSQQINESISMGSYGHKLLEIYYKNLLEVPANIAASRALEFDPLTSAEFKNSGLSQEKIRAVQDRFNFYWMRYSIADFEVAYRAKKSLVFSDKNNFKESYISEPLVEQGFSYKLLDTKEYLFVLEGRIDLIAKIKDQPMFVDHKWQLRMHNLYPKAIQFRNYSLATGLYIGLINYIRLHQNIQKDTFVRQPISFSPQDIYEWKQELIEIFIQINKDMKADKVFKNRSACPGKYGYHCQFVKLCEEYNPQVIESIKSSQYYPKQEWKPW